VGALTLLYRFLPNAYVRWNAAAVAGGIISIALEVLRGIFGLYVHALDTMNLITGYLALILLSLFSIYLLWVLILLGVELTRAIQSHAGRLPAEGTVRAGRTENAIRMLLRLSQGEAHAFRELYDDQEAMRRRRRRSCIGWKRRDSSSATRPPATVSRAGPRRFASRRWSDAISPNLYTINPRREDRIVLVLEPLFARLEKERRSLLGTTLADLADG
jgi:hypothetical protein